MNFMFAETAAELAIFAFEACELDDVLDRDEKLFGGERFLEKIHGAEARGAHGHFDIGLAGNHHDRRCDAGIFQIFEKSEAIAAGHDDIRKN